MKHAAQVFTGAILAIQAAKHVVPAQAGTHAEFPDSII
jgi:hypothetical protein